MAIPQGTKLPERVADKLGPGVLRRPSDTVGPKREPSPINPGEQSDRSKAAAAGSPSINRADTSTRTISRDGLTPGAAQNYGMKNQTDADNDTLPAYDSSEDSRFSDND